jgi:hypothetical protein
MRYCIVMGLILNRVFDLRNELVNHLITPYFFYLVCGQNELIHHCLIPPHS